ACLALRPEVIAISDTAPAEGVNALPGRVEVMSFHGAAVEYRIATEVGPPMTARATAPGLGGASPFPQGSRVWLCWHPSAGVIVSEH
ncbi:TOBE domain-containing protein, partial [Paracoccus sp. (in: a-proteobacteria)]|uniref:TOBE domain-containing protein n=1 Tax=Paracoccus sp. TaxID=267 RepID=UPI0035AD8D16